MLSVEANLESLYSSHRALGGGWAAVAFGNNYA